MEYKKCHRKYPDSKWEYRAISTKIFDNNRKREVIYYTLIDKGKRSRGVELYSGENYVTGSDARSHSRRYSLSNVPSQYKDILKLLIKKHNSTKWSKKQHVAFN
jgi:hypothetical protein